MKALNLYAGLGGNRTKWNDVIPGISVTAVELEAELAMVYKERFPNDNVIVGDAHRYLLKHFKEYDFIWTSPPCPTHSRLVSSNKNKEAYDLRYPDMRLYQEIIFLSNFFKGKYCVENVIPYYRPLIQAQKRGRHYYWCNFKLPKDIERKKKFAMSRGIMELQLLEEYHGIKLNVPVKDYRQKLRNMVDYKAGEAILRASITEPSVLDYFK